MPQSFSPPDNSVIELRIPPTGPTCRISPGTGITITINEFFAPGICDIQISGSNATVAVEYS
jgi:hypothetical protein